MIGRAHRDPARRNRNRRLLDARPEATANLPVGWHAMATAMGGRVTDLVRIGNCSGFYGDRLAAMREMLTGGDLDFLTGDYLAELTMLILARDRAKAPERGYAKTFLTQLEDCLGIALDRGVRIVANAGGLNPAGLATAVRSLAERLGLNVRVAHVEGDDLVARAEQLRVRHAVGGQRLPRRVGHRRLPQRRRRRRRHRPGHRRLGDRRARRRPLRLGPHRLRRARRCGGRGPCHRMRHPGHRRQLLVLHRSRRPHLCRLPARRDPRRRIVGDHQTSRDRRAGQRRHRHRATALRDHRRALRQPRCDAARRLHPAERRRRGPGAHRRRGR